MKACGRLLELYHLQTMPANWNRCSSSHEHVKDFVKARLASKQAEAFSAKDFRQRFHVALKSPGTPTSQEFRGMVHVQDKHLT